MLNPSMISPTRLLSRTTVAAGRRPLVTTGVILASALATAFVALQLSLHPQMDDATVEAEYRKIAPQVEGPITELFVTEKAFVERGAPLFLVDPRPYQYALDKALSERNTLQAEIADHCVTRGATTVRTDDATEGKLHLKNTSRKSARIPQTTARHSLCNASSIDTPTSNRLQLSQSRLERARLQLQQALVVAPFDGYVTNLKLSIGASAQAGMPVLTLIDAHSWFVVATRRLPAFEHIDIGSRFDLYLMSQPNHHFEGRAENVNYCHSPTNEPITEGSSGDHCEAIWGAPNRAVRSRVDNPDPEAFRMGLTALAIKR